MAKGKSSATSGTRKKHARKAAGPAQTQDPLPKEKKPKGKDKNQKKEPRQKMYIPPVKPAPIQPDPLETTGLAHQLPPDLLVALRRLGKKDAVTKRRALEELQMGWVDRCRREGDDSPLVDPLVIMLPVWIHHLPALSVHAERRIRLLTAGLHGSLLHISAIREALFFFLRESATTDDVERVMGTWCMAAHDVDRQLSTYAQKSWNDSVSFQDKPGKLFLDHALLEPLLSFIQRVLLDPKAVYAYLNPTPPVLVVAEPPARRTSARSATAIHSMNREDSERPKGDTIEEETEADRKARLRVGAFGALKWTIETRMNTSLDDLMPLLSNAALWSSLQYREISPLVDIESFGSNQPGVRKCAWALLQSLLRGYKDEIEPLLHMLSYAVLRSAWVEPDTVVRGIMLQPLLTFLKEFPTAWELENTPIPATRDDDEGESGSEHEDEQISDEIHTPRAGSQAYREFLQFLELGCSGTPLQGYPIVVIILSTIPSSILASSSTSPLADFFTSFWAAIDGRALSSLERAATSAAFLSSILECTVFLVRRLLNDNKDHVIFLFGQKGDGDAEARKLVLDQFQRVWEELVKARLRTEGTVAGRLLAQTLLTLYSINEGLFTAAWDALAVGMRNSANKDTLALISALLNAFNDQFDDGTFPGQATLSLTTDVIQSTLVQCESVLEGDKSPMNSYLPLATLLDTFGSTLFRDVEIAKRIDDLTAQNSVRLLSISPSFLLGYLRHRQNEEKGLHLWRSLLSGVSGFQNDGQSAMATLLDAARLDALPKYLVPAAGELDAFVGNILSSLALSVVEAKQVSILRQLLQTPQYFLSESSFNELVWNIMGTFRMCVDQALRDPHMTLEGLDVCVDVLDTALQSRPHLLLSSNSVADLLPHVFIFGYLLPRSFNLDGSQRNHTAQIIWTKWLEQASADSKVIVLGLTKTVFRDLLMSTEVLPSTDDILRTLIGDIPNLYLHPLIDIFPTWDTMNVMLDVLSSDAIDCSLGVLEPLLPPCSMTQHQLPSSGYDKDGYSSYARVVMGLLQFLLEDRRVAKENMWALRHILALALYARDFLRIPSATSEVFDQRALRTGLNDFLLKSQQLSTYLLSSSVEDGWHSKVVESITKEDSDEISDNLGKFVVDLTVRSKTHDSVREARVLRVVLQHILGNACKEEADQWILLARKMEKIAPEASMAIVSSVTEFAPEPPRLDRYRNELAADLLGVSASEVNTTGLLLLRRLAASAPDQDSDVVFLPQLRAVNVMKACQQWITSDEDIDEEVESMMTLLFSYLAPILQNVPGSHWDLVFDMIESNLENCSFIHDSTLVTLARTLQLILVVQDLTLTNKTLRADWKEWETATLMLVRDLTTVRTDSDRISVPRSVCRELALLIIQQLPTSLMDHETLPNMCHLLTDSSLDVQKMAYHLLQEAARKRTEHLVIEAGVDTEANVRTELPIELIEILRRSPLLDETEYDEQDLFGYLLGWMVTFDLFKDASLRVRSNYIDQLRVLGIIETHFIPNILSLLKLYDGIIKTFKLDIWVVEEYYIQLYEPGITSSVHLLAAHLYYRALSIVPSLIRSWVSECKDKQLHMTVVTYTSLHFSPVIIRAELAHVKSPKALAELTDENLSIKVSNAVNEVTAVYTIDEHQLEITLKMPSDWPLHGIEIRDKRVAVLEKRWRAWVLGVQQIIWSQNGHIVDGLSLFKKNVSLHFEGKVECAICYSIISVMDGSLPRKPCRTCRNSFHSGCLYKWFNTSHSSSCPLCRSDMV